MVDFIVETKLQAPTPPRAIYFRQFCFVQIDFLLEAVVVVCLFLGPFGDLFYGEKRPAEERKGSHYWPGFASWYKWKTGHDENSLGWTVEPSLTHDVFSRLAV